MIIKLKRVLIFFVVIVIVLTLLLSARAYQDTLSPPSSLTIVIDAGHGGIDGGAIGVVTGNKESDLNLDIALLLGEKLKNVTEQKLSKLDKYFKSDEHQYQSTGRLAKIIIDDHKKILGITKRPPKPVSQIK